MQSNANTKPIGGEDLKILDIMNSLEKSEAKPRIFQTTNDIENFKIFSTNGFSIGITQHALFRGIFAQIVYFRPAMIKPWI